MMIHKLLFSSVGLGLFILSSCSPIKTKLLYEGDNQAGKHSRALMEFDESFIVAGKDGVFSVFNEDFDKKTDSLKGAEDIRDIHVFSDGSIIFLNSGEKGKIWKMSKDLRTKELTYDRADVFLDGMAFWDDKRGVAYADPVNGKFIVAVTTNAGATWRQLDYNVIPYALPNEAGFAASGTGIAAVELDRQEYSYQIW